MSEIELKPCPFCGGEASTKVEIVKIIDVELFTSVSCKKCNISRGAYVKRDCSFKELDLAMNMAVEKWNGRADNG